MPSFRPHRFLLIAALFAFPARVFAAPHVAGVRGTANDGATLVVYGDGFGEKKAAAPIIFADFEKGLDPNPESRNRSWDAVQNMTWAKEGPDGKGCAKASDGSGTWTMAADHKYWSKEGEKAYIFRRQKLNFMITNDSQNWKIWRMWPKTTNYPNIYMSSNNGRVYVENVGEESGFWGSFNVQTTEWVGEEIFFQASNTGIKDGIVRYQCNGTEMCGGSVMTRSLKAPEYMERNYVVHAVAANKDRWSPSWLDTNRVWVDEVYADNAWSRVMMGDKPLKREGRKWEILVPKRWAKNEIEVLVNAGVFKPGETAYLFVFDSNNRSNETGWPVRIGPRPKLVD
jgi:hypothetical protein